MRTRSQDSNGSEIASMIHITSHGPTETEKGLIDDKQTIPGLTPESGLSPNEFLFAERVPVFSNQDTEGRKQE